MLIPYEPSEASSGPGAGPQAWKEQQPEYSVRTIMSVLNLRENELQAAIEKAKISCRNLKLSFEHNARRIFCYDGQELFADLNISPLLCYLIVIHCEPVNVNVAKAQLYFLRTR